MKVLDKGKEFGDNPTGALTDSSRVIRGGGWVNNDGLCQSATRLSENPLSGSDFIGFRVVRRASPQNY